jgi:hypothetical protein
MIRDTEPEAVPTDQQPLCSYAGDPRSGGIMFAGLASGPLAGGQHTDGLNITVARIA